MKSGQRERERLQVHGKWGEFQPNAAGCDTRVADCRTDQSTTQFRGSVFPLFRRLAPIPTPLLSIFLESSAYVHAIRIFQG